MKIATERYTKLTKELKNKLLRERKINTFFLYKKKMSNQSYVFKMTILDI